MDDPVPDLPRKGRGAVSNRSGRFEAETRERVLDEWPGDGEPPPPLRTTLSVDTAKRIITYNNSPDIPFDRSINPYRGCEHGCVYCFARPTHAFYGLSPGLDFESKLFYKPDAAALLKRELREPKYRVAPIAMGTNTDPYQPIDREIGLTREILAVLRDFQHPVTIVTKSNLILRDLDILSEMAAKGLASVAISVTTLDRRLARVMEPRAPTPARRIEAIRALNAAGVPTGALVAPIIPAINDMDIDRIVEAVAAANATSAGYVLLRLPLEIKDLFEEWLAAHFPDRQGRVMSLIRQTRDGAAYRAQWGKRMSGTGPYAELLKQRFALALKRNGLARRKSGLDISRFRPPPAPGDQLSLL
jgi:DNA repair photolyase